MYEITETEALRQISYFSESAAIGFLPPLRDTREEKEKEKKI